MIEGAKLVERTDTVLRLASLPSAKIEAILIARGVDPVNVDATVEVIAAVGIAVNALEAIDYPFRAQPIPPSYPNGRFGDGTYPVFYSALEEETCIEEVRHHRRSVIAALQSGQMPFARYFTLIKVDFVGLTLLLRGSERTYPDLTSQTADGYPFCRAVARWAQGAGAQALHTTSARRLAGTCVPIFVRECINNAVSLRRYRFYIRDGELTFEELAPG